MKAFLFVFGLHLSTAGLCAAPIRPHPTNPHYFEFRGQPTILVTSAEHYGGIINSEFDWRQYLQTLGRDGMNYTRVFVGSYVEGQQDIGWMLSSNTLAPRSGRLLAPWARSHVPGYYNGGNKFDLDHSDNHYFARLKSFVQSASEQGVVVELTLFGNQYGDSQWAHSPLKASNNIQGIGGSWEDFQTLRDSELTRRQEQMVRKILRELKDAENVIYEISNEPFNNQLHPKAVNDWHRHIAAIIAEEEKALGVKHLVAANEAVHEDPNVSMLNWHYVANFVRLEQEYALNKPIALDETNGSLIHSSEDDVRVEAWEWICGGGACYNNLSWDFTPSDLTGKPGAAFRRQLKVLRARWFRPRDGTLLRQDRLEHKGSKLQLVSPAYDDADVTVVIRSDRTPRTGATKGTLRVHPGNRRYFTDGLTNTDGSFKAVYLGGHQVFVDLQDNCFNKEWTKGLTRPDEPTAKARTLNWDQYPDLPLRLVQSC